MIFPNRNICLTSQIRSNLRRKWVSLPYEQSFYLIKKSLRSQIPSYEWYQYYTHQISLWHWLFSESHVVCSAVIYEVRFVLRRIHSYHLDRQSMVIWLSDNNLSPQRILTTHPIPTPTTTWNVTQSVRNASVNVLLYNNNNIYMQSLLTTTFCICHMWTAKSDARFT